MKKNIMFKCLNFAKVEASFALSISNVLSSRQVIARNLARTKLFELQLDIHGSVVECGSHRGDGLGLFYHLSSVLEPTNLNRKSLVSILFLVFQV